ncbi:magnesium transporter MgtE N-terminal domain-containing protein [Micromonospora sediminicola]|uniref:magnesium transporter MgtE N-terminal domain-containing protein n=1 Tax=Micromonospora sediminicola TaxID=946078 RepID=UPI0034089E6B
MADETGPTGADRVEMNAAAQDGARIYQVAQGTIYVDAGQARSAAQRLASMPVHQSVDQLMTMSQDDACWVLAEMDEASAARRLAALPRDRCAALLAGMDEGLAAKRLVLLPQELAVHVLGAMPAVRAADLLVETPPDRVPGLLDGMPPDRAAALLGRTSDDRLSALLHLESWTTADTVLRRLPAARVLALSWPPPADTDHLPRRNRELWARRVGAAHSHAARRMAADLAAVPDDRALAELSALPAGSAVLVVNRLDETRATDLLSRAPRPWVAGLLDHGLSQGAKFLVRMPPERAEAVLAAMSPRRADLLHGPLRIGRLSPRDAAAELATATVDDVVQLEAHLGSAWLYATLSAMEPARVAAILGDRMLFDHVPADVQVFVEAMPTPRQATVLAWLPPARAAAVVARLGDEQVRRLLTEMPAQWGAVLAAGMPVERRRHILDGLPRQIRQPLTDAARARGTAL